jgi:ABC-type sugar transport system ATPase subunit
VGNDPRPSEPRAGQADLAKLNLDIDPKAMVSSLAASSGRAWPSRVRSAKPEYPHCLLVLDEPTATLPVDEVDNLRIASRRSRP